MKEWRKHGGDVKAKPDCKRLECYSEICVEPETCYGLTPECLTELRRIAEAATPGPWIKDADKRNSVRSHWNPPRDGNVVGWRVCVVSGNGPQSNADWDYITEFNPKTTLALLDRIEALEDENERLRQIEAAARTLVDTAFEVPGPDEYVYQAVRVDHFDMLAALLKEEGGATRA